MNMNQFTQKSLEAIQNAQNLAAQYGNQQIEQPHLLLALLDQEGGFIPQLLTHMGLTLESFRPAMRWSFCPRCPAPAGRRTRYTSPPA